MDRITNKAFCEVCGRLMGSASMYSTSNGHHRCVKCYQRVGWNPQNDKKPEQQTATPTSRIKKHVEKLNAQIILKKP